MEKSSVYNNKFFEVIEKISDLIILNFLCVIFSIPIITIGASVTSLYYVSLKIVNDEEPYIVKTFIRSFKANIKISTIIWSIFMLIGGVLLVDFYICNQIQEDMLMNISRFIFLVASIIYMFMISYVFPLISKFENSIKNTIINSILISIQNLPYTIIINIINLIPLIFIMIKPGAWGAILFFYVVIGVGMTGFMNAIFFNKIFNKYIEKD